MASTFAQKLADNRHCLCSSDREDPSQYVDYEVFRPQAALRGIKATLPVRIVIKEIEATTLRDCSPRPARTETLQF